MGSVLATLGPDALLGLLAPFWQLVVGAAVVVFTLGAAARLARRGRSRMNTAIVVTGGAVVGLVLIGVLVGR